jgi:integrase
MRKKNKIKWETIEKNIAPNKWQCIEEGIYLIGRRYHIIYSNKHNKQIREKTGIIFESIKETKIGKVRDILASRKGNIVEGKFPFLKAEKVTFDELAEDLIRDYEDNNQEVWRIKIAINHLSGFFKGMKAVNITSDMVKKEYIPYRRKKDPYVTNSTINVDLAALIRMFNLAAESNPNWTWLPKIKKLSTKGNQRTGFFEIDEYMKMKDALPEYLVPSFMLGYKSGMRREEIYSLLIDQYNSFEKQLILKPLDTKTKESRILNLDP